MKLKYFLSIALFIIHGSISYPQSDRSNIEIIDRLIDESLVPVANRLTILGTDKLYELHSSGNDDAESYLFESLTRQYQKFRFLLGEESDSSAYKIEISRPVIKVEYKKIYTDDLLGTKRVQRVVRVSYNLQVISIKDPSNISSINFDRSTKDSFDLDKLDLVQDRRYSFSEALLPEESDLNKILLPALIVLASAATIALFFIIRSK